MTPDSVGPLSRPVHLGRISPSGTNVTVDANEAERAALAADLGLPAIHALSARFRLVRTATGVRVDGDLSARVEQTCVVTLDPFPVTITETVDLDLRAPDPRRREPSPEIELDPVEDGPEDLVGDSVDLGTIAAEFLALGLDPYPRKPGVAFEQAPEMGEAEGPFARLASLRAKDPPS